MRVINDDVHGCHVLILHRTYGEMGNLVSFALGFALFRPLRASWRQSAFAVGSPKP